MATKKTIYLLNAAVFLTITANAAAITNNPGPYLGGQVGWARIDEGNGYKQYMETQSSKQIDQGTFTGWRAYIGYNFTPFFSVESGYAYYPDNNYTSTSSNKINIKSYTIDLVGKIILPLQDIINPLANFSLYGKGGGAYINTKLDHIISSSSVKRSNAIIRPTYGAGVVYNFNDNIAIDASWTGVYGKNKITTTDLNMITTANPTPTTNLFTLGLSYKITGLM